MPVYVYHCENCGIQFEQQQKFSDNPLKKCPECGHVSLHKVYSPVGIIYKGSGFYSTDHRSSSGTATSSKPKESTEKSEDKPQTEKVAASDEKKPEKKVEKNNTP